MSPPRPWTPEGYAAALHFAARAHGDQREPVESLPYLHHVTWVAAEVLSALREEPGLDEELAVQCALLHDVLEDTEVRYDELAVAFGDAVARGVLSLSKNASLPKPEQMRDSLARIRLQPREVWIVKLADRTCNLHPPLPRHWTHDKALAYRDEAELILRELGAGSGHLARRLRRRIDAYGAVLDAFLAG